MTEPRYETLELVIPEEERRISITPTGILAAAFSELVKDAEKSGAWWRSSPLLAGIGLAYHLDKLGYEIVRKEVAPSRLSRLLRRLGLR